MKCAITSISLNRTHIWAIIYWNAFAFCLWDLPTVSTDTEIKLTHENVERVGEVRWSAGSYVPWIFPLRILRLLLHILATDLLILGLATRDFSAVFPFTFFFFFFFLPRTPLFISLFFRYSFLINRLRVLIAAFQRPRQVVIQPSRVLIPALLTVQSVCRPSFGGESFFWASRLRHDFLCPSAFQVSDIKLFLHIFWWLFLLFLNLV